MDNQEIIEVLRLIAGKSDSARRDAVKTILAINNNSPIVQKRLNIVARIALDDRQAEFTQDEISLITQLLNAEDGELRDYTLLVRLTQSERIELERLADEAGMTKSDYVRSKIF